MPIKFTLSLAVAALLALLVAGTAQAALTVTNANDSGPGSLRQTVFEAGPGETINVPAGTYTLTSGPLKFTKGVTIAGHDDADTVIRSGGAFRVVEAIGPFDLTISGVTIRDATIPSPAVGAGILTAETNLTLRGVSVTNNTVNGNGGPGTPGGIAQGAGILSFQGKLNLIESSVTGNTATAMGGSGAGGGAAFAAGLGVFGTDFTIVNSTISGNLVDARGGQGPSNAAQGGGVAVAAGVYAIPESPSGSSIVGSTIANNVADGSAGPGGKGGVALTSGLYVSSEFGPVAVSNTTVASNLLRNGGTAPFVSVAAGMLASTEPPGSLEILGSTIAANRIEAGSLAFGGNILFEGAVRVGDTIVANGSGGEPGKENCAAEPPPISLGFNIDGADQCGFKAAGDRVNTNPQLGPLQSNGGLTQTMAPALGSPAIDQGRAFGLTTDQRGVLRPIDLPTIPNSTTPGADGADIGAVEFQPSNAFALGKLKRNKKKGTATLSVLLPSPSAGTLMLTGKGLKTQAATITGQTEVKLKVVAASKKIKKALRKKGKRKVGIVVTYTPTGNSAATQSRKAKLVKKKKRRKKR